MIEKYKKIVIEALETYRDLMNDGIFREGFCPFSYLEIPSGFDNSWELQCDLFCYYYFPDLKSSGVCPCTVNLNKEVKEIVDKLLIN